MTLCWQNLYRERGRHQHQSNLREPRLLEESPVVQGNCCLHQPSSLQSDKLVVDRGGAGGGRRLGGGLGHHNSPVAQLQQLRQMEDLHGQDYYSLLYLENTKNLLFKHFLRVLVVVAVFESSHLPAQKPTMNTVGVSVASWEGFKRK